VRRQDLSAGRAREAKDEHPMGGDAESSKETMEVNGSQRLKTCPFCAEEIQEAAIKCKHCGSDLIEPNDGRLRVSAFIPTKKGAEVDLVGCSREEVADAVERFFFAREFKRESGDKYRATYGLGSAIGRVLAGGLVKRSKYAVVIADASPGPPRPDTSTTGVDPSMIRLTIQSEMSGMSGSIVGIGREQVQRREFINSMQTYLMGL
jgi:hypothetical protein